MSTLEFESLVLSHWDGLRPFAVTLTRDHETARDLCQETLYKAFTYREKYQAGTNIKAWLFTIMRNIFINDYRRSAKGREVIQSYRSSQPAASVPSEIRVRLNEINQAIYNLPGILKTACLLYLEGYKYQDIAFALNEPLGTIKSRIHFARKMLQKQIDR